MKKSSSLKFIMVFIMMFKALLIPKVSYAQKSPLNEFGIENSPLSIAPFGHGFFPKQSRTKSQLLAMEDSQTGMVKGVSYSLHEKAGYACLQYYAKKHNWRVKGKDWEKDGKTYPVDVTKAPITFFTKNSEESHDYLPKLWSTRIENDLVTITTFYRALDVKNNEEYLVFNPNSIPNIIGTYPKVAWKSLRCGNHFVVEVADAPAPLADDGYIADTTSSPTSTPEPQAQKPSAPDTVVKYVDRWHYYTETKEVFREGYCGGVSVMFAWGISYDMGYSCIPYQQPYVVQNYYNIDNSINSSFNTTTTTITPHVFHHNPIPLPVVLTHGDPSDGNGGNPVVNNPDVNGGGNGNGNAGEGAGGRNVQNHNNDLAYASRKDVKNDYFAPRDETPKSNLNPTPRPKSNTAEGANGIKPPSRGNDEYNPAPKPKPREDNYGRPVKTNGYEYNPKPRTRDNYVRDNNNYSKPNNFSRPTGQNRNNLHAKSSRRSR